MENDIDVSLAIPQELLDTMANLKEDMKVPPELIEAMANLNEGLERQNLKLANINDAFYIPKFNFEALKPVSATAVANIGKLLNKTIEQNEDLKKQNAELNTSVKSLKENSKKKFWLTVLASVISGGIFFFLGRIIP